MDVRRVRECEFSQLVDFLYEISPDLPRPLVGRVDVVEYAKKLLSLGAVYGIPSEDGFAGIVGGYMNDIAERRAVITIMGVRSTLREGGQGTRLIRTFESNAIANGMRSLDLETHCANEIAIAFYKQNGYRLIKKLDNGNVLMRKHFVGLSSARPNVLLTSAGRRTYLVDWFKESLSDSGKVHAVNSDGFSPALLAADEGAVCPLIYSEQYIPFLKDYCITNRIGAIISLFDIDIPVLAAHMGEFEALGVSVVVAPLASAEICNDKYLTYRSLAEAGLNAIPTYIDLVSCLSDIEAGAVGFPLIVKPRWGMGSIGVYEVDSEEELLAVFGIVKRKIEQSYLKYESENRIDEAVLIQAKMPGQEYGLDVINDLEGRYRGLVVRKKLAMRAGETDVAEVVRPDARFEALGRALSDLIGQPGNMDVDVFDCEGSLYVLEMNARFGGGYPFSHAAGVDLPSALVSWLRNEECGRDLLEPSLFGVYLKDMVIRPYAG